MFEKITEDFRVYAQHNHPVAVLLASKGFHALLAYRVGHWCAQNHLSLISFLLSRSIQMLYGIDIHWDAHIEGGLRIVHGYSLVIGSESYIGKNCSLYHEVTLGSKGEWASAGMPKLGAHVVVYPGAKILGPIRIAEACVIGANSVVVKDCLEKGVYGGNPARRIK